MRGSGGPVLRPELPSFGLWAGPQQTGALRPRPPLPRDWPYRIDTVTPMLSSASRAQDPRTGLWPDGTGEPWALVATLGPPSAQTVSGLCLHRRSWLGLSSKPTSAACSWTAMVRSVSGAWWLWETGRGRHESPISREGTGRPPPGARPSPWRESEGREDLAASPPCSLPLSSAVWSCRTPGRRPRLPLPPAPSTPSCPGPRPRLCGRAHLSPLGSCRVWASSEVSFRDRCPPAVCCP